MTNERRLIQDLTSGDLRCRLLRAGREAAPSAACREHLLAALLPQVSAAASAPVASLELVVSSLKAGVATKLAALTLVGAAATGAWYAVGGYRAGGLIGVVAPLASASHGVPAVGNEPQPISAVVEATLARGEAPTPLVGERARSTSLQRRPRVARGSASTTQAHTEFSEARAQAGAAKDGTASSLRDTHLREELRELDAAWKALRTGDGAAAAGLLDGYFQRFPDGFLQSEALRLAREARRRGAR